MPNKATHIPHNGKPTINKELILNELQARSPEEVLSALSDRLCEKGFVKASFKEAVIERERTFPTGLPSQIPVAIPHTDAEHNLHSALAMAVLKEPVLFHLMGSDEDTIPVRLVFMLTLSEPEAPANWIGRLTDLIRNRPLLESLITARSSKKMAELLRHHLSPARLKPSD